MVSPYCNSLSHLLSHVFVLILFVAAVGSTAVAETIYPTDSRDTYTIFTDLMDEVTVNDGAGGVTTTVNYVSGGASQGLTVNDSSVVSLSDNATITAGGFTANGSSTVSITDNAVVNNAPSPIANDNATVNISGGTFAAQGFDMTGESDTTISGGTFNCSQSSGGCLRAFGNSTLTISAGTFNGGGVSIAGLGTSSPEVMLPQVTITGGTFNEGLDASRAIMDIFGGNFDTVDSRGGGSLGSTVTIFGSDFEATCAIARTNFCDAGEVYLSGFGVIQDFEFTGTITGKLADGTDLAVTSNVQGFFGASKLILAEAPIPVPPAAWLFGSALIMLGWSRRHQRR